VVLLIVGIVVLDLGIQGQQILNQTIVYSLRPEARSRLTTAYMAGNFLFGALASAGTDLAWRTGGWLAVCAFGGGLSMLAVLVWLSEMRRGARMPAERGPESAVTPSGPDRRLAEPARSR
jgi:cyanate permease